jgi:acid stress-induced BolA-like protein IbaG/YrbA
MTKDKPRHIESRFGEHPPITITRKRRGMFATGIKASHLITSCAVSREFPAGSRAKRNQAIESDLTYTIEDKSAAKNMHAIKDKTTAEKALYFPLKMDESD